MKDNPPIKYNQTFLDKIKLIIISKALFTMMIMIKRK